MKYLKYFEKIEQGINGKITTLDYSGQGLTELPKLPSTLITLYCNNNNLTKLPKLPSTLKHLKCSHNYNLSELPILPDSITELRCYDTKLPYSNLIEYKKWLNKEHPEISKSKKFNI